jgi:hypothetical protein
MAQFQGKGDCGARGTLFLKFGRVGLAAAAMGGGIKTRINYIIKLNRYL